MCLVGEMSVENTWIVGADAKRIVFVKGVEVAERMTIDGLDAFGLQIGRWTNFDRNWRGKQELFGLVIQANTVSDSMRPDVLENILQVGIVRNLANMDGEQDIHFFETLENGVVLSEAEDLRVAGEVHSYYIGRVSKLGKDVHHVQGVIDAL